MRGVELESANGVILPAFLGRPEVPMQLGPGLWELRATTTTHVRLHSAASVVDPSFEPEAPLRLRLTKDTDVWCAANDNRAGRVYAVRVDEEL